MWSWRGSSREVPQLRTSETYLSVLPSSLYLTLLPLVCLPHYVPPIVSCMNFLGLL